MLKPIHSGPYNLSQITRLFTIIGRMATAMLLATLSISFALALLLLLRGGTAGLKVIPAPGTLSIDAADNLIYRAVTGNDNNLLISLEGERLVFYDNGIPIDFTGADMPSIDRPLLINLGDGDDTLTVDFSTGNPLPAGGVIFDGGLGGYDTLEIRGGEFDTIISDYTNASDGNISLDNSIITYIGLEPILINAGTAADIIFNLPAGGNTAFLEDDGNPINNTSQLRSGGTFELTAFNDPANTLTINGGSGNDALNIDFSTTNPIPTGGLTFNGGNPTVASGDLLALLAASSGTALTVTHTFSNASDGTIDIDALRITYTGLEPIYDNLAAVDRLFKFGATANIITLADDQSSTPNQNRISSLASSEVVYFANPNNSLIIEAGGGNDKITVDPLDPATGKLELFGEAGNDTILSRVLTETQLIDAGAGNDTVDIELIELSLTSAAPINVILGDGTDLASFSFSTTTIPLGGITVAGGTDTSIDTLILTGDSVNPITHTVGAGGIIDIQIAPYTSTLATTGFEVISDTLNTFDRFWVFAASTTDVEYTLTVVDTQTNLVKMYNNPLVYVTLPTNTLTVNGSLGNDTFTLFPPGPKPKIIINGGAGQDNLEVDFSAGITGDITFAGGLPTISPGDTLTLTATIGFDHIRHDFLNGSSGTMYLDEFESFRTLSYTGLEPIIDNLQALTRTFNFSNTADTITLSDDAIANNGMSRLSSITSSETITFTNPISKLLLNAAGGDDTVTVSALDSLTSVLTVTLDGGVGSDTLMLGNQPAISSNFESIIVGLIKSYLPLILGSSSANGPAYGLHYRAYSSQFQQLLDIQAAGSFSPRTVFNIAGGIFGLAFTGDTLYGTECANPCGSTSNYYLLTLPHVGTVTGSRVGGPIGFPNVEGLAYCPTDGKLYGASFDFTPPHLTTLITINPATGIGSAIGTLGPDVYIVGLACHPTTGTLYGISKPYATNTSPKLYTINKATAGETLVGGLGLTLQGLAWDNDLNRLIGSYEKLYSINTASGAATEIGGNYTTGSTGDGVYGLAYPSSP